MSEQVQKAIEERERRTRGEPEPKAPKAKVEKPSEEPAEDEGAEGSA